MMSLDDKFIKVEKQEFTIINLVAPSGEVISVIIIHKLVVAMLPDGDGGYYHSTISWIDYAAYIDGERVSVNEY